MKQLWYRIYSDYFLPSRLGEYEKLNKYALDNDYQFITILEHYRNILLNQQSDKKIFLHRHDIDTDVKTAKRFFEVEQRLNIKASYYFRLNTIDIGLMNEIHAYGSEVGYHYEELATFCKLYKIKNWELAKLKIPEMQVLFENNFRNLEQKLNFKIDSIASHGDFVNRFLGKSNYEIIDEGLMKKLGIQLEGYNNTLLDSFTDTLSDKPYPKFYRDKTPEFCINQKSKVIYLLTHTRHWHVARLENTSDNLKRFIQGIKYKL